MQGQLILAIRLVSDAETKVKNLKYNHCWHSCNLNGTFCDCGNHFDQQYSYSYSNSSSSKDEINKYESSLSVNKKPTDDTKIGVVSATFSNYDMTLKEFRRLMEKQIDDLPPSFIFLFNNGYPVSFKQEKTIKLKHIASTDGVIDIRRKFSLTRYGIMSVYGEIFGFVFLDSSLSVVSIRTSVVKDLQEIHSFKSMQNNFFFCDRNGWPLTAEQEFQLTGWDIIADNMIRIRPFKLDTKVLSSSDLELNVKKPVTDRNGSTITLFEDANHVDGSMTNNLVLSSNSNHSDGDRQLQHVCNHTEDHQNPNSSNPAYYSRHSHSLNSTAHYHPHYHTATSAGNNSSPDILNLNGLNDSFYKQHNLLNDLALVKSSFPTRPKPILISYVRKEAEQHARNLKTQLTSLGCDVYLDVDEIKVGMDWQDALNDAVNSCEIFIPLVTPNYGLTLWTNREIKYADIKNKLIVPINFLKQWPPDVLAIQFATTQFLAWKTKEEIDEDVKLGNARATDITAWDNKHILRIAKQISELVKKRSVEKSFKDDELSFTNAIGEFEHATNDQINSLENSIEDNLEADTRGSEPMEEDTSKEDADLVKLSLNQEIIQQAVDTIELDPEAIAKTDQVDQHTPTVPLSSLVSLSAFDNLPPPITRSSSVSSSQHHASKRSSVFADSVLSTLSFKSAKTSDSSKATKRTIQQPQKDKQLIVISAHPAQRCIVNSIRNKLSQRYLVWSSLDINPTLFEGKDEVFVDRADRFSASLNSLSSSVTNSVDTDPEINDLNSNVSSVQNFSQILSGNYDDDQLNKLDSEPVARINTYDQSVLCHRADKHPKFDKCFYRNQMTSRKLGKSQWYIDSSDMNSQSCILQPDEIDKVNIFKEKVNEARIVIILLSEDYIQSKTSKRQFFYCDFRKQILPVNLEDIKSPSHWVSKLLDNEYLIQKSDCSSDAEMVDKVCGKLCTIIKAEEKLNCKVMDLKVQEIAETISKKLIICNKKKLFIYVMGSTKFKNPNTKELCEKIGRCLAKKEKIILVTGGALGVADTLAQSFYEERKRIRADSRKQSANPDPNGGANKSVILQCNADDQKIDISALDVIHILPKGEVGDLKCKYRTNEDGTFEPLPYGHTVFLGDSIEDRDCTVSRVFQFCILIEGGMGSAKIAQDFIYNENIVVPISTTGYAAAGNFISEEDCGNNITEMPSGVSETDWLKLNKRDLPICELSNTIFNIIDSLSKYHPTNVRCKLFDTINKKIYGKKCGTKAAAKATKTATDVLNQFNSLFKVS